MSKDRFTRYNLDSDVFQENPSGNMSKALSFADIARLEKEGDYEGAYAAALLLGQRWKCDQLAAKYDILGHEFEDFYAKEGETIEQTMARCLESRFKTGAIAHSLGFKGMEGKIVADIGCNDGRYLQMARNLGASEVFGIDPLSNALEKAIKLGRLDKPHAIIGKMQDIAKDHLKTFDVALVFNPEVPPDELKDFFAAIYHSLSVNGQLVLTFAEKVRLDTYLPILEKYFVHQGAVRLFGKNDNGIHAFMVACNKKPETLVSFE